MTVPETASAAPVPIKMAGKTWRMSPLSDGATAEITQWRRKREVQIADDTMPAGISEERWMAIHNAAVARAGELSFPDPHDLKIWSTFEGLAVIYWHMLRPNHPDLTLEATAEMLMDAVSLDEANAGFEILEVAKKNVTAASERGKKVKKVKRTKSKRKNRKSK